MKNRSITSFEMDQQKMTQSTEMKTDNNEVSENRSKERNDLAFMNTFGSIASHMTKIIRTGSMTSPILGFANNNNNNDNNNSSKWFIQVCYLSIAAIFGTLLRLILAQVFGQACSNPGTVGWIKDESVLCVTATGETTQPEGIIFADLPANILGSFIMGLLQDGASLGLAINAPIAFLKPSNTFQSLDVLHLALRTGFCGSLTTFSAWNSEMVVLMVGNHDGVVPNRESMIWRAMFGYLIGIETAIGSYVFGRTCAWWFHKLINPVLAEEKVELNIRQHKHGMVVNRELPTFERRYLHRLFENKNGKNDKSSNSNMSSSSSSTMLLSSSPSYLLAEDMLTTEELEPLAKWRESTTIARQSESGEIINNKLVSLETSLIARREAVIQDHLDSVVDYDWDLEQLQIWLSKRQYYHNNCDNTSNNALMLTPCGVAKTMEMNDTIWYTKPFALMLLLVCLLILINLMMHWVNPTPYDITYRTMAYSMLFSPPGALLRWKLSGINGKLGSQFFLNLQRYNWLPIGTLSANLLGSLVSISMISIEYLYSANNVDALSSSFWIVATIRAIKIGFSGCLSTVSTFISEVHRLSRERQDRAYKYILATLILSSLLSAVLFMIII